MGAFALQNAQQLGAQAGSVLTTAPMTVLSPMNYTIANVRPFDIQVATAVDFVGLIYLLILTVCSGSVIFCGASLIAGLVHRCTSQLHRTEHGDAAREADDAQAPPALPDRGSVLGVFLALTYVASSLGYGLYLYGDFVYSSICMLG
jgi:hypothetical protein